jgi:hypothetical protein
MTLPGSMDFEIKPVTQPVIIFVLLVSGFMTSFGIYWLSLADETNYLFILPFSILFLPWLPFWMMYIRTAKVRFTRDKLIKSSFLGTQEMKKDKIQFFGIVYRARYVNKIIRVEEAMEFSIYGNCQINISEYPSNLFRIYPKNTIKIPFQKDNYEKIKGWLENDFLPSKEA